MVCETESGLVGIGAGADDAWELEADVTAQGKKAKMDMKANATFDESQEVTLSVPSDLQDAPKAALKTFFSS